MTDRDIIQDFNEIYEYERQQWEPWWDEAGTDLGYHLGKQWSRVDQAYIEGQQRNALVFNKVRRVVNIISGHQRKNRLALRAQPVESADDLTASQFTGTLMYDMTRIHQHLSKAFENGSVKTGINLLRLYNDYSLDLVSGDINAYRLAHNQFLLDSNWTREDLKDCQHILARRYMSRDYAMSLLPEHTKDIDKLSFQGGDNKFPGLLNPKRRYDADNVRFDEFWRRVQRPVKIIIDTVSGEYVVWKRDVSGRMKALLDVEIPTPDGPKKRFLVLQRKMGSVELNIMVEGELFYTGPDPSGIDDYPLVAEIGYFDHEYDELAEKLQGVIRCMRDPQTEINKRRSKLIDILDSQLTTGWEVEEDATPEGFEDQYFKTGQGQVILGKPGAISGNKIRKTQPTEVPQGLFQAMGILDQDIMDIPGVNAEMFGMPENNQQIAGFLAAMRSNAGIVVLQSLFDNHRFTQAELGRKLMRMQQRNYHPSKVKRILGQDPTPQFYDELFSRYDAVCVEGVLSDTQKQMYFMQLLNLQQMGAPIPWSELIEACPLELKDSLKKAIKAGEQAQQKSQQQSALLDQLTTQMMQSKIMSDVARAGQSRASEEENRANAMFDRVRIAKELDEAKDDRVFKWLDMITRLTAAKNQNQGAPAPAQQQGGALMTVR
jgi:hypothetical protein